MNIEELKKIVKSSTAVLVLDDGEPSFVILGYDSYKDMVLGGSAKEVKISHAPKSSDYKNGEIKGSLAKEEANKEAESEILERINKDILALKEEIEKEEKTLAID